MKGCGVVLSVLKVVVHSYLVVLLGLGKETKMYVHRCVVAVGKEETGITLAAVHLSPDSPNLKPTNPKCVGVKAITFTSPIM